MAEFDMPNNSHAFKEKQNQEKPKPQKVISGKAKVGKKTTARKFADLFLPEDVSSVKEYIFWERVVPAIKDIINDTVQTILYGESRSRSYSNSSRVSYQNYYSNRSSSSRPDPRNDSARVRNGFDYDDIYFNTRVEAENVLDAMIDMLEQYDIVTVGDLYDFSGITNTNYMLHRYGWTNLGGVCVVRVREGYVIKLPKAKPI